MLSVPLPTTPLTMVAALIGQDGKPEPLNPRKPNTPAGQAARTGEGGLVVVQAHEVGRDGAVAAGAAREHDRAAHLVQGRPLLARQQPQRALKRGKVDLARTLQVPCRSCAAVLNPCRVPGCSRI